MHIKHIHEMMEKLTKCAEMELEKGVENVDTKEMGEVVDIIKDLAEAEYYAKISKAMDEAEYGEEYDYKGAYDDGRRGYRGQPRSESGRFMSRGDGRRSNRGRGGRRGYEEPMYYTMTPEMYREYDAEELRDMDRERGRMGFSDGSLVGNSGSSMRSKSTGSQASGENRGYSENEGGGQMSSRMQRDGESRYDRAKRGYEETKAEGDKTEKMKSLEEYMKELSSDVSSMLTGMTPEEKSMMRTKLTTLASKVQ